jgi:hypothetical protein
MTKCVHGMNPEWCASCSGTDAHSRPGDRYGYYGGETKQDLLDAMCAALGLPQEPVGVGSSLPSHVFNVAAQRTGVPVGSTPEIGRAVTEKAGLVWTEHCDSTGSASGGGSTVTATGLRTVVEALRRML